MFRQCSIFVYFSFDEVFLYIYLEEIHNTILTHLKKKVSTAFGIFEVDIKSNKGVNFS